MGHQYCVEVLSHIPQKDKATTVKDIEFNQEALPTERALGVYWNVGEDSFSYVINIKEKTFKSRDFLSLVSSTYDPLGFACSYTVRAKAIIQVICRRQLG